MSNLISIAVVGVTLSTYMSSIALAQTLADQNLELVQEQERGLPSAPDTPPPNREPGIPPGLPVDTCITNSDDSDLETTGIRHSNTTASLTIRNSPTLLFYVSQSSEIAPIGEFILETRGGLGGIGTREVYRSQKFQLLDTPGIIALTIPSPAGDNDSYLEIDQYYRWHFKVYCVTSLEDKTTMPQELGGWIRRVSEEEVSAETRLYYDELADAALAQLRDDNLDITQWQDLLQSLGFGAYSEVPIIDEISL